MSLPVQIPRRSPRHAPRPSFSTGFSFTSSSTGSPSSSSTPHSSNGKARAFETAGYSSAAGYNSAAGGYNYNGSGVSGGSPLAGSSVQRPGGCDRTTGERRESLLGSALLPTQHTVVNVGPPTGPPRLISCVKASQGFEWNEDIFLPSYGRGYYARRYSYGYDGYGEGGDEDQEMDNGEYNGGDAGHEGLGRRFVGGRGLGEGAEYARRDKVVEILLDEDECRGLMPQ